MTARDVLSRGRDAMVRLREIDTDIERRRARLGVRGHDPTAFHSKTVLLHDTTRKIDELLDAITEFDTLRLALEADVAEGKCLCRGVSRMVSDSLGTILELHFIGGLEVDTIAAYLNLDESLVSDAIKHVGELDALLPKLLQAGK